MFDKKLDKPFKCKKTGKDFKSFKDFSGHVADHLDFIEKDLGRKLEIPHLVKKEGKH